MNCLPELKLAWCSHEAARYAVENWHYSKCMPSFKVVKIGVWEAERFIGCILFSMGANAQAHCPYGIEKRDICELTRIALDKHATPVTRIVSIALRLLKQQSPGIRLVVSYADPEQGHDGGIYKGGGWIYVGQTSLCTHYEYISSGKRVHSKTIATGRRGYAAQLKAKGIIRPVRVWKYKYLMPLDAAMRKRIEPLCKPYLKRVRSVGSDTPAIHAGMGGATPTRTLLHGER